MRRSFDAYAEQGSVSLLQWRNSTRESIPQRSSAREALACRSRWAPSVISAHPVSHPAERPVPGQLAQGQQCNLYAGQHEAIIDTDLWERCPKKLEANRRNARALAVGAKAPSPLSGLIFDSDGNRMTPTHANKSGRRYRYYISASLLGRGKPGAGTMRIPASEVEGLVLDQIRELLASQHAVGNALAPLALDARVLNSTLERAATLSCNWIGIPPEEMHALLRSFVTRVKLLADRIDITIGVGRLADALGMPTASRDGAGPTIELSVAAGVNGTLNLTRVGLDRQLGTDPPAALAVAPASGNGSVTRSRRP